MDFETVRGVLESEYGQPPEKIFASIDSEPAGSASIAQAHRAVLKDGRPVILKVQRPGIYEKMAQDMRLLHRASSIFRIVRKTGQVIGFDNVIDEMWSAAQQELDFLIEASHIREFTENNVGIPYIAFPQVEATLTTQRVLVMEYVDGIQIDDTEALKRRDTTPPSCATSRRQLFKQVVDGFFHGTRTRATSRARRQNRLD